MFDGCISISLDLSKFYIENVNNMAEMFQGCSSLENLYLSDNFNPKEVINITNMLNDCKSLKSLDLSVFNAYKALYIDGLFANCSSLAYLNFPEFNTYLATGFKKIFYNYASLTSLYLPNLLTISISKYNIYLPFYGCDNLTVSVKLEQCWNLSSYCPGGITIIDLDQ